MSDTTRSRPASPPAEPPTEPPTHRLFIGGEWVESVTGRTFESVNPADTREVDRPVPGRRAPPTRPGRSRGRRGLRRLGADAGPEARRDPVPLRRAHGRAQGAARPGDDPRDGQGPGRGARRRPGGDRHRLPDGRRGPPDVRRHDPVGAARQVGDERPPAARRRRDHHPLELPDRDPVLEDDAGPGHRQHGRVQAVERHAPLRDAARRADGRGRLPARHGQPRDRARGRRSATRS